MSDRDEMAFVQLKLRVREKLRARLAEAAEQRGVSMNAEIVIRLERSLEQPEMPNLDEMRAELAGLMVEAAGHVANAKNEMHRNLAKVALELTAAAFNLASKPSEQNLAALQATIREIVHRPLGQPK
jgi:hypothetical protein